MPGWQTLWPDTDDEQAIASRWAAEHPKRFLTAPVAIGTIDQALLSGLQVTHAHLRAGALARNLLVVDEVHASDHYMRELLRIVVRNHTAIDDFVKVLNDQVAGADVLLAVIGPRWSELLTARANDPDDFVAVEIKGGSKLDADHGSILGESRRQKAPASVTLKMSGSTGCEMLSITPFWQTAVGGGVAEKHAAYKLSVLISDPYA